MIPQSCLDSAMPDENEAFVLLRSHMKNSSDEQVSCLIRYFYAFKYGFGDSYHIWCSYSHAGI